MKHTGKQEGWRSLSYVGKKGALALTVAACLLGGGFTGTGAPAFAVASAAAEQEAGIQDIVGQWYEAGAIDSRSLTIHADGTYKLTYREGGAAYGTVKVMYEEHPDGSRSPWYGFLEKDGTMWAAFAKPEAGEINDLWSGQDGAMHFVRGQGHDFRQTREGVKAADYLGVWGCGRYTVVIEKEDGRYHVSISWAGSAATGARWDYRCTYDEESALLVCSGGGIRENYEFSEDGAETLTEVYLDGHGTFAMREGVLTWQDKKENAGESIVFRK
ncbi:MAG: hypothetical protein IJS96_00815 [Schwartzia sp.]|nr:hypothetical protein [Schwartzia sp. (in: firmicutes)]